MPWNTGPHGRGGRLSAAFSVTQQYLTWSLHVGELPSADTVTWTWQHQCPLIHSKDEEANWSPSSYSSFKLKWTSRRGQRQRRSPTVGPKPGRMLLRMAAASCLALPSWASSYGALPPQGPGLSSQCPGLSYMIHYQWRFLSSFVFLFKWKSHGY